MDQAASVLAVRDAALYVSFKPRLDSSPISFPYTDPELAFVIAQSFVAADKHVTAPVCYNLRVVECTLAAAVLAKIFGLNRPLPVDSSPLKASLRGFQDAYFEQMDEIPDNTKSTVQVFERQLEKLIQLTDSYLVQEEGYSRADICTFLGISEAKLDADYMTKFPVRAERFKLRQRALHVFKEASRVIKFRNLLASPPETDDNEILFTRLASLMTESQESLAQLYECSCRELDELCSLALARGASGSRLTGAGWGGCTVHLVPSNNVAAVKKALEDEYYKVRFPDMTEEQLAEAVVVSKPGSGSAVFDVLRNTVD